MEQVSDNCFAVLHQNTRICDANSGLVNLAGGVVIDTQSDLAHARRMMELFGRVWAAVPQRVVNTHEDADHVWGNQLFRGAEIIAHRSVPDRMRQVADPQKSRALLHGVGGLLTGLKLGTLHPGTPGAAHQWLEDYDFDGIELVLPTTLFDARYDLDLDGIDVHVIYVGPCHQVGDTIVHVPTERVVFAGDVVFRRCTPIGWTGTYAQWFRCLDLLLELDPEVIVPGHGPLCGIEGACEMRAYLEYVRDESRECFHAGLPAIEAAKRIEFGPYAEWRAPARLFMNVERAYREFRNEPPDSPWDASATVDAICAVATARGLPIEF
jgi:glyoxylase-like metal-dependent hydrolase (beta-lactamase superfamily II)